MTSDLPQHARERLQDMRARQLFTSDLSVSEFLLVKEAGFDPLGLVMGSSIYQITPTIPQLAPNAPGCELVDMTRALYHARELAMNRMEQEADALGADGIVGVRLTVKLGSNPLKQNWDLYREWQDWARSVGFRARPPCSAQAGRIGRAWRTTCGRTTASSSAGCRCRRRPGRGRARCSTTRSARTWRNFAPSAAPSSTAAERATATFTASRFKVT